MTHSSFLAWRIPWTEEPDGLQSWGHKETDMNGRLTRSLCSVLLSVLGLLVSQYHTEAPESASDG